MNEKYKHFVHHIIEESSNPDMLGAIRLNKALWFSDIVSYLDCGESITGEIYVKNHYGPTPKNISD